MITLGLTGGIGMGKSACDQLLRQRGVPVVDTDLLARDLVKPGEPALAEIARVFGAQVVDASGHLRRGDLARRVFSDAAARRELEALLHPRIRALWHEQIAAWRVTQPAPPAAVVVIPLLFETGAEPELDATVCVACSAATQRSRLQARGWTHEQIAQRLAAQMPIEQKMTRASRVIWTEGPLSATAAQLDRLLHTL
jgi:dephospho-CoA kinase